MKRGRSRHSSAKNTDADALFDENAASSWGKNFDEEEIDETESDASAEVGALSGRCDFTFLAKDDKTGALGDAEKNGNSSALAESEDVGGPANVEEPERRGALESRSALGETGESAQENVAEVALNEVKLASPSEKTTDFEDEATEETARIWSPNELVDDILLSTVDGVGPLTAERLIGYFGSASEVLRASRRDLERVEKVGPTLARKISQAREACDVEALIR
ncbi:MAG: hypothetical protein IJE97_02205, partial [Thermoguttaceae bacterium]|nr:hypothetical protein [Thermoguttaceae bacterium]